MNEYARTMARVIREKKAAGNCVFTDMPGEVDAAHVYGREFVRLRTEPDNIVLAHRSWHSGGRVDFESGCDAQIGCLDWFLNSQGRQIKRTPRDRINFILEFAHPDTKALMSIQMERLANLFIDLYPNGNPNE